MAVLVLVEAAEEELSRQALGFAGGLGALEAVSIGAGSAAWPVERVHVAEGIDAYAPGAWATAVEELIERLSPTAVVAAGTTRGNEVLAHVAARRDLPFAANCIAIDGAGGESLTVTRMRWGGSLLEEARIHSPLPLMSVAPHAVQAAEGAGSPTVETFTPALGEADLAVRVAEHVDEVASGISLAEAKVVVSGGRGVGSADGFGILEELAGLLDAAVGCSRVVTSAGWRPHTDQVGQTGTKVSPDLYIACGISGATQHIAGCKGAKKILAINSDAEAPILASADYAVIGDLTEIVPAITAELRKARSLIAVLVGALALALALAVSGFLFARRARLLVGLVRMGKPADRSGDLPQRARNEAEIVLGQRKLLQRLVPGLIHAAIFWGFLVLFPTILIAMIGAVSRDATLPWLGHQGWFALLVDVFAVLVLAGVIGAALIRKVQRPARFEGSHLGEADLILALIAGIVTTLLLWHGSRIALGLNEWPASWSPVSKALSHLFGDGDVTKVLERVFVWAHVLIILTFLAYLPHSKHLHIATAAVNVFFTRTRARGRLEPLALRRARGGDALRGRHRGGPDLEADAGHLLVHGVRPLPGRVPGLDHRQGALAEAADHGAARSGLRGGTAAAARRGRVRGAAAGARRGDRQRGLGLRDLRRLRARVPGVDRARGPHRRPAPAPGDDGGSLPRRGRADAARRRARRQPVGQAADRARRLGRAAGRARARAGRPCAGGPLLGRLRGVVRRARADGGGVDGAAAAGGRRGLRDPGPARVVHRGPGAAHGQRVPLPGARRAERGRRSTRRA